MALVLGKAVIARPRSGEGYTFELPSGILPDGKQSYLSVNPMGYAEWSSMSEREGFPAKRVGQEVRDAVMPSFSRPARAFSTSNGTGLRPSTEAGSLDALGYRVGERLLLSGDGNSAVLSVPGTGHHLFARSATSEWGWETLLVPADTVPGTAAGISRTGEVVAALGQSTLTSTDVLCTVYGAARTAIHVETLVGAAAAVRTPATAATAATWGAYEVTASSETATAWQAFAASGYEWKSTTGIYDPTTGLPLEAGGAATLVADPEYVGEWIKLSSTDSATALRGDALVLARGAALTGAPAAFRVYGSNDDASWDLLGDFSGVVWTGTPGSVATLLNAETQVSAGIAHSAAVRRDGALFTWGANNAGQATGDGTTTDVYTPVNVSGLTDVVSVACGHSWTVAALKDGTVWAWGNNAHGMLGNGTTTASTTPVQVLGFAASDKVVKVAAGWFAGYAITDDGRVFSWGASWDNQIGRGGTSTQAGQITGLQNVVALSAGHSHALALTASGEVFSWGNNGQANGTGISRSTPVQVTDGFMAGKTAVSIGAGGWHSIVGLNDGTVAAFGSNTNGELGDGLNTASSIPVQVSGIPAGATIVSVDAGENHSLAVLESGEAYAWGRNEAGMLGTGTTTHSLTAVQVDTSALTGFSGFVQVSAGGYYTLATLSDGSVASWGTASSGRTGRFGNGLLPGAVDVGTVQTPEIGATEEKTFPLENLERVAERGYKHIALAVGEVQTDAESTGDGSVSIGAGTRLTAVRVQAKVAVSGDGSTVVVAHRDVATGNVHVRLIRTGILDSTAPVSHSVATTLPWGDVQTGRGIATDFFGKTFAVRSADAVEAWRLTSAWTASPLTFSALSAGVPDADHTLLGASGVALSSSGQEVFVPVRNLVSGRVLVGAARVPYGTWPASATLVPSSEAVTTGPVATPDAWTAGARLCAQSPDATWLSFLLPDGTGYVFCTESSRSSTGVPGGAVHGISERGDMVVWDAESTTVLADTTVTTSLGVARVIAGTYAWGSVQDGLIVRSGTWSGTVLANWGLAYYDTAVAGGVVETHEKVTGWSVLRRPPAVLSAPLYQEKVGEASLSFVATKDGSARPPFVVPPSSSISVTLNGRFLGRYINDTTGYVTAYLTRLTQPNTSSAADATAVSDTLMTTDINDASVQSLALEKDTRYVLAVYYYNKGTQTSVSLEGTATALEVGAGAVFLREATHVLDLLQQVTFAAGFDPNPSPGQATPWSLSTTSAQDAYDAGRPAKIFNNGLYLIAVADFDTATEEVFHSNYIEFDEVPAGTDPDYYSFRLVNYQTRDVLAYVAITAAKNGGITSGVWFDLSSSIMDSVLYYKDPEAPDVITSSSGVTGGGGGSGDTSTQVITMDGGRADLVSARSLTGDALPVVQAYSDGTTTVASAYLDTTGVFSLSGVVSLVDGSASEPAFRFSSSTQTGLLYDAARQAIAVSVSGTVPARFYSGAVEIVAAALRPATTATTALGSAGLRFGGLFLAGDADLLGEVRAGDAGYTFGSTPGFGVVLSAGQDAVEVQAGGATKAAFLAAEVRVSADVAPETDAAYDLGVTGRRFRDVRASGTVSATDVAVSGAVTATGSTAKLEFPTAGIDANTVRATGSFFPAADATYDLGSPDRRWKTLYVDSNTIYLGDIKLGADASGDFSVEKQVVDHSTGQITTQQATIKTDRVQIWDTTSSSVGSRIRSVDSATYMEVSGNGVDFTEVLRLSSGSAEFTGTVRASGEILALSDRRLKTDIEPITGALDRIGEMQGVTYRFAKAEGGKRNIGLIAQEVQAAFPEAVTEGSDGMLAVNYGGLVGALVAALNESRAETRALAERVAALEGSR